MSYNYNKNFKLTEKDRKLSFRLVFLLSFHIDLERSND